MDLLTTAAVVSAVESVTSDAVAGAAGEFGRRASEALAGLVRRIRHRDGDEPPALPEDTETRRELADRLLDEARRDPGFARDLESWLRDAAPVTAPPGRDRPLATARPRLLPPGTAAFTDREQVLATVEEVVDGLGEDSRGPGLVALLGPGGIGKTATAVHCAHALADRFPGGQLYADLRGVSAATAVAPSEILVRFLTGLGVPPSRIPRDEQAQADLYRDQTAHRRLVVLLDNAHSAPQIVPLLTASPRSLVLVTSRYRLPELVRDYGARLIALGPLSAADSVRLLTRIVGPARIAQQPAYAEAAAGSCGGMPLALCATGARAAEREHLSWERIVRDLTTPDEETPGEDDDPVRGGGQGENPAFRATDLSYRELSPPAARLYRLLGLRPWPGVPVGAAAAAAGIEDEGRARALLEELAGVHLLEEVGEERYRFHDLVRQHAERRARQEEEPRELTRSTGLVVRWFLRGAAAADTAVLPGRWRLGPAYRELAGHDDDSWGAAGPERAGRALDWLRRERENLVEAVRAADEHGFDDLAWQVCEAMWGLHLKLGFYDQWATTHTLGVAAARRCVEAFGDARAEGRMRVQRAFALMGLRRFEEAEEELRAAASADRRAGHSRGEATALETLGLLRLRQWRYEEAETLFADAARTLATIAPGQDGARDVPRATAILAHHTGRALRGQGRLDDAVRQLLHALVLFRELDDRDPYNEARVQTSLGETFLEAGDPSAARQPLDDALTVLTAEGAWIHEAEAARLRARCARELSDPRGEVHYLRMARSRYERTGETALVAHLDTRLADLDG
ncbi:tetratricopeptide repeat protein [Streptomyces sp. URMC 129]|uniref:tetratricopeptide repeat protein n=1 Tax=Streptomyces sp. URMC 129 TaxID=3423407 RepID=UPI003F1C82A7